MAGGAFVVVLVVYVLGLHSDPSKLSLAQAIQTILGCGIGITCIVLGTKERREATPADKEFGYGQALGTGVMITLFAALFGLVSNFIYMQLINPGFQDVIVQAQVAKWEAAGMSATRIEQAEGMMRKMMSPPIQMAIGFIMGMLFGTVISLISSAFLKRPSPDQAQPVAG
jgi:hypothetical protein